MPIRSTQAKGPYIGVNPVYVAPTSPVVSPTWFRLGTFAHTAFQITAPTNSIALYTLPIKGVLHAVHVVPTVQFAGAGMTSYRVECGILGELDRYTPLYDVLIATPSATEKQMILLNPPSQESLSGTSALLITAVSDVNLSLSTAGSLYVNALISVTP